MSNIITARALWQNDIFFGDCDKEVSINSNNFAGETPKFGYLNRVFNPIGDANGIAYALTFANPNADALTGVWIETTDGQGVLIDADPTDGVSDVIAAADACCGESTAVTPHYAGTYPAMTAQTLHTGTVVRADAGTFLAKERAELDYYGRVLSIAYASRSGSNSTYNITYYTKPVAIAGDTVTQLS